MLTEREIEDLFVESGALKEGHFKLTSGLHSSRYVDKFKILSKPRLASPLMTEMAERWKSNNIELVVGPAVGGIILSYEIARQLGCDGIFLERKNGKMALSRGFSIEKSQRILLVEDVVTTGGSVNEVCEVLKQLGGEIAGISLMVDRSGGKVDFGIKTDSLIQLGLELFEPESCPMCSDEIELETPGSSGKDAD
ncbi:MAG: orotate phosphoribosyltransferase [Candidatus Marinimicrobia bacterium]|nr:orotate phosphoribosyltransferase [Candidatus Neomarinimicrobiota bacterium]